MNRLTSRYNEYAKLRDQRLAEFEKDHPHARPLAQAAIGLAIGAAFIGTSDSSFAQWMRDDVKDVAHATETQATRIIGEAEIRVADFACRVVGLEFVCPPTGAELYNQMQGGMSVTDIPRGSLIQNQTIS